MPIAVEKIDEVAALAKLRFTVAEKKKIAVQLDRIVSYVEKLNELDLENVEPTTHVILLNCRLRQDTCQPWLTQEEALKNAPVAKNGFFSVPKVIT